MNRQASGLTHLMSTATFLLARKIPDDQHQTRRPNIVIEAALTSSEQRMFSVCLSVQLDFSAFLASRRCPSCAGLNDADEISLAACNEKPNKLAGQLLSGRVEQSTCEVVCFTTQQTTRED